MLNLYCKILLLFLSPLLLADPVITVISPLNVPSVSAQITETIVVAPTDTGAAILRVTGGTPLASVTCAVEFPVVTATTPPGLNNDQKVVLNNWIISCPGVFDNTGAMDVRLGATIIKQATNVPGLYTETTQALIINY